MVRVTTRCAPLGLLWWILNLCGVDGLIEIVEEQRCQNYEFRLTCRDLDNHIAVLEAWYTSTDDYHQISNTTHSPEALSIKTENDSELDRVYVYSSPKHNGVYEPTNHSMFENVSNVNSSDVPFLNETFGFLNETLDSVEFVNDSEECGAPTFARSYGSWREGDKRRRALERSTSINLRAPVSYRCTGVNHCSFIMAKDYKPSASWPDGVVYIKYACFDDSVFLHYCNREVLVAASGPESEGYIRTPGYPHYYVGEECRWRLRARPEQRLRVTLLDVSLRSIGPFENHCTDFVSVLDSNGETMLSSCDQVELPLRLTSTTDAVEIVVEARSQGAFPKRGVLFHYKSIGCVTLSAPSDGYLVYRNEDVAHYMCNPNRVFEDTRQRARVIWCYDDNRWNDTVPLCVDQPPRPFDTVASKDTKLPHNEPNMMVDIVIPSLLIVALFIGNAFIVLIIYKYRKRDREREERESKFPNELGIVPKLPKTRKRRFQKLFKLKPASLKNAVLKKSKRKVSELGPLEDEYDDKMWSERFSELNELMDGDSKPDESTSTKPKPDDSKPAESKPDESKPDESKPDESKTDAPKTTDEKTEEPTDEKTEEPTPTDETTKEPTLTDEKTEEPTSTKEKTDKPSPSASAESDDEPDESQAQKPTPRATLTRTKPKKPRKHKPGKQRPTQSKTIKRRPKKPGPKKPKPHKPTRRK